MITKIGLAGKSGSGKDLIADEICNQYGFYKIAVADPLKIEVFDQLVNPSEDFAYILRELNQEDWLITNNLSRLSDKEKLEWVNENKRFLRRLLQFYGTEYRRRQDPEYWIKILSKKLDNRDKIVISDIRLPDEMEVVHESGGEVWFVERPGISNVGIAGHATEHGLDNAVFDYHILNDGSMEDLRAKVDARLSYLLANLISM